jgi:hypothetical protein
VTLAKVLLLQNIFFPKLFFLEQIVAISRQLGVAKKSFYADATKKMFFSLTFCNKNF